MRWATRPLTAQGLVVSDTVAASSVSVAQRARGTLETGLRGFLNVKTVYVKFSQTSGLHRFGQTTKPVSTPSTGTQGLILLLWASGLREG